MIPGDERWRRISKGEEQLTPDEILEGWHFCQNFDMDLVCGDDTGRGKRCCWCGYEPNELGLLSLWRRS